MLPRFRLPTPARLLRPLLTAATLAMAATSLAACASAGSRADGTAAAQHLPIHGIDVSKYQGRIDWQQVAGSGVRFAYLKATEGGDRSDDMFAANWAGARSAGLATGAYHFFNFCRPVEDQIAWFQQHVPPAPDALPPVLDVEWNAQSKYCPKPPPYAVIRANMHRFLSAMQAFYGKRPVIYTDIGFHRDVLSGGDLGDYPFWLRSVKAHPSERYSNRGFAFWQYTATGRVPGVKGNVDRNAFAGTEAQWDEFLQSNARRGAVALATATVRSRTAVADAAPALAAPPPSPMPAVAAAYADPSPVEPMSPPAVAAASPVAAAPMPTLRPTVLAAAPKSDLDLPPVDIQTFREPALNGVY